MATIYSSGTIHGVSYSMLKVDDVYEVDIHMPYGSIKKITALDESGARRWINEQVNNYMRKNYED